MKNLFFLLLIMFFIAPAVNARYKWEKISYYHSTGPVSPEYQYNYIITIDEEGKGKLEYTKSGKTNVYDFNVSKKNINALNKSILKTKVLNATAEDLKPGGNLIGGPVYNATITLTFPDEEEYNEKEKEKPPVVIIPNQINEKYSSNVFALYTLIESLVPSSVWSQATGSKGW